MRVVGSLAYLYHLHHLRYHWKVDYLTYPDPEASHPSGSEEEVGAWKKIYNGLIE